MPGGVRGVADRVGADAGKAILGPAQSIPQRGQRPARRAIPRTLRRPSDFGQDAPLLDLTIADPMTTAMVRHHRSQAVAVETGHPARDGVADLASHKLRRHRVALPLGHCQQGPSTGSLGCRGTL